MFSFFFSLSAKYVSVCYSSMYSCIAAKAVRLGHIAQHCKQHTKEIGMVVVLVSGHLRQEIHLGHLLDGREIAFGYFPGFFMGRPKPLQLVHVRAVGGMPQATLAIHPQL